MRTFKDRVAVITGAGSGIGRALSVKLAEQGARIAICDLDQAGLEETSKKIELLGGEVHSYCVDVANHEKMLQFADNVIDDFGQVDILINNAGVTLRPKRFEETTHEEFKWLIGINQWGVYNGIAVFLPHLRQRPEASIVNMSSLAGLVGVYGYPSYAMSKFAVRGLSEALQMELANTDIRVTIVHPGGVKTSIMKNAPDFEDAEQHKMMVKFFSRAATLTPEKVAVRILRAVRKKRYRVILGVDAKLVFTIRKIFPRKFPHLLRPMFAMMMGDIPGKK